MHFPLHVPHRIGIWQVGTCMIIWPFKKLNNHFGYIALKLHTLLTDQSEHHQCPYGFMRYLDIAFWFMVWIFNFECYVNIGIKPFTITFKLIIYSSGWDIAWYTPAVSVLYSVYWNMLQCWYFFQSTDNC